MQEAFPGATVIDRIEASFSELVRDANTTSTAARNAWIIFLALIAYFLITLAAISDKDLLLDSAVKLPILDVQIGLKAFFLYGPVILVLIHFSLLLQHAVLARKVRDFHDRVTRFEGQGLYRQHRSRVLLHSYFYTQLIAGPFRSAFFALMLRLMSWFTLAVLPVIVLLGFQVTFLPYHDLTATWAHRVYLIADLLILMIFGVFMRFPERGFVSGFGASLAKQPVSFLAVLVTGAFVLLFSICVATIPDERMDRIMTSIWPVPVPTDEEEPLRPRSAFGPTVALFEGRVDYISGKPTSVFGRNLVVTDADLVRDADLNSLETSISLRRRDLRYGVFDRSDLHGADLTGAFALGASFRLTNLYRAKAELANIDGADMRGANLLESRWRGAAIAGADFTGARFSPETFTEEQRATAKFPK